MTEWVISYNLSKGQLIKKRDKEYSYKVNGSSRVTTASHVVIFWVKTRKASNIAYHNLDSINNLTFKRER